MTNNHYIFASFFLTVLLILLASPGAFSQEPKVFTWNDFDLVGKVKKNIIITDYGKEEFEFNEKGILIKSVTRFNDSDYDVTYYKVRNGDLMEKRVENYRDGQFDKTTSIANIYRVDTTNNKKIIEKIISYDEEFLDEYVYIYNADEQLVSIKRTNESGTDMTVIKHRSYKEETTTTYFMNEEIQKSIRNSQKQLKNGMLVNVVLTKNYLNGKPVRALEQFYNENDRIISENRFSYSNKEKQFISDKSLSYSYDESGILSEIRTQKGKVETIQEYIYQYDSTEGGNWIKEIITPGNAYTSRIITYFQDTISTVKE